MDTLSFGAHYLYKFSLCYRYQVSETNILYMWMTLSPMYNASFV